VCKVANASKRVHCEWQEGYVVVEESLEISGIVDICRVRESPAMDRPNNCERATWTNSPRNMNSKEIKRKRSLFAAYCFYGKLVRECSLAYRSSGKINYELID
jgi:hypothetical protein